MSKYRNEKFVSLMDDAMFKSIWSNKNVECRNYLNRIIERIVGYDVSDFELSTNDLPIISYGSIANRVDVILTNKEKLIKINIEMNTSKSDINRWKNDTYAYKLAGEFYASLKDKYIDGIKIDQINLNNFHNVGDNKKVVLEYSMQTDDHQKRDGVRFYDVDLPLAKELWYDSDDEFIRDLAMFAAMDFKEMAQIAKGNKERKKIMEELQNVIIDPNIPTYNYDEYQKALQKEKFQQGIQQGIEQGILDKEKEDAINFYNNGVSKELICKSLNITEEKLEEYLNSVNKNNN